MPCQTIAKYVDNRWVQASHVCTSHVSQQWFFAQYYSNGIRPSEDREFHSEDQISFLPRDRTPHAMTLR
ncbi:hypothetical protein BS47DRAFT_1349478 [Hydnum rufescens UP504]|uniref:Uncharacterized protein n=1 Tax=Hydnum rufescens UP504 TaxID=1448309 RepID=A0A9P6ANV6_9AGAM|nr:hypothetical protein BS47DRAFT_1349478 [Hydnum rufescens UP504]